MREVGRAIVAAVLAPWTHLRLSLLVWLALLLPVLIGFSLPLYDAAEGATAHNPDATRLLHKPGDKDPFVYAFVGDFVRNDFTDTGDRLFWIPVTAWVLMTVLSGGVVARLVGSESGKRPLLLECGRLAGRFLRLALVAAFVLYMADLAVNFLWAMKYDDWLLLHHTEALRIEGIMLRGAVFVTAWHLLHMVHAYAKIDIVHRDGRSALLAYLRGIGIFLRRIHRLVPLELGLLLVHLLFLFVAFLVLSGLRPKTPDVAWHRIGLFLGFGALYLFLRSGFSVGVMVARTRLILPTPAGAGAAAVVGEEAADFFEIGGAEPSPGAAHEPTASLPEPLVPEEPSEDPHRPPPHGAPGNEAGGDSGGLP
ncbi:MAG: hypothetical protein O7C98_11715 [Planctomycetota bacterium]|nr:hypothetical protein [Planctomycetota bacterium]